MPTNQFYVSLSNTGCGDAAQLSTTSSIYGLTNNSITVGTVFGKPPVYRAAFLRFDISILPSDIKIKSVKLRLYSNGVRALFTMNIQIGFIVEDGIWNLTPSLTGYDTAGTIPFAQQNNGATSTPSVFVNSAPASKDVAMSATNQEEWSFGENAESTYSVVGLVSQLQTIVDGSPTCCIQIFRPYVGTSLGSQGLYSSISTVSNEYKPRLIVEWDYGDSVCAKTNLEASIVSESRLNTAIGYEDSLEPKITGVPKIGKC